MEIKQILRLRGLSSDMQVFVLLAIAWSGFYMLQPCPSGIDPHVAITFAAGAGVLSLLTLKILGYFDPLRLVPRTSDLLLALLAMAIGGVCQQLLFWEILGFRICSLSNVALWTPALALVVFGSHYLLSWLLLKQGRKRKVVLDLLPIQKAAVIQAFEEHRLSEYIEFVSLPELRRLLLENRTWEIRLIVVSDGAVKQFDADGALVRAHLAGVPIYDQWRVVTALSGKIALGESDLWTYIMDATPQTAFLRAITFAKLILEPLAAAALAFALLPVIMVVALLIKRTSPGPVFYRQLRTGYLGRPFTLIKFRSMVVDSEKDGPRWAAENDDRLTRIGGFLRRTRLDELPQLWNVMTGQMSFFGPRPERPEIYAQLRDAIPLFAMRLIVRPGISGWAQVCAGYAASVEESKIKLEYDLYYIQHMSPRLDMIILIKTLKVALFGDARRSSPLGEAGSSAVAERS